MGGRAAEIMIFAGDISSGAADDLQRATEIGLEMVTRFGMDDLVGHRTYAAPRQTLLPGVESTGFRRRKLPPAKSMSPCATWSVRHSSARKKSCGCVGRDLDAGAQLLLKRETVTVDDFPAIRSAKLRIHEAAFKSCERV